MKADPACRAPTRSRNGRQGSAVPSAALSTHGSPLSAIRAEPRLTLGEAGECDVSSGNTGGGCGGGLGTDLAAAASLAALAAAAASLAALASASSSSRRFRSFSCCCAARSASAARCVISIELTWSGRGPRRG